MSVPKLYLYQCVIPENIHNIHTEGIFFWFEPSPYRNFELSFIHSVTIFYLLNPLPTLSLSEFPMTFLLVGIDIFGNGTFYVIKNCIFLYIVLGPFGHVQFECTSEATI